MNLYTLSNNRCCYNTKCSLKQQENQEPQEQELQQEQQEQAKDDEGPKQRRRQQQQQQQQSHVQMGDVMQSVRSVRSVRSVQRYSQDRYSSPCRTQTLMIYPLLVLVMCVWISSCVNCVNGFTSVALPKGPISVTHSGTKKSTITVGTGRQLTDLDEYILFGNAGSGGVDALKMASSSVAEVGSIAAQSNEGNVGNQGNEGNQGHDNNHESDKSHNQWENDNDSIVQQLVRMRYELRTGFELWDRLATIVPNQRALYDAHLCDEPKVDLSFAQARRHVHASASVFQRFLTTTGTPAGTPASGGRPVVAVFGENSAYWLLVDHGIQRAGGISAVRGADAPTDELRYIYGHCDSAGIVVLQDLALLQKLVRTPVTSATSGDSESASVSPTLGLTNDLHGPVKTVILMHRGRKTKKDILDRTVQSLSQQLGIEIAFFGDLLQEELEKQSNKSPTIAPELDSSAIATIVYTSGTTGNPKGVMLTHSNLLHQITHRLESDLDTKSFDRYYYNTDTEPLPGETMVSLLPVWHITERTFELWMLSRGCNVVYSTIRTFKKDLALHKPQWMVLVPRVLEKIATGVQEKFSSSGPAVRNIAKFFTAVGKSYTTNVKISKGLVAGSSPSKAERILAKATASSLAPLHSLGQKLVWSKVRDGFGGRIKVLISGGSALASGLESFYETAGLNIIVGYGLTECSPILAYRRTNSNLVAGGCAGKACIDTEIRIVDPELKPTNESPRPALPVGQVGLILGKGPQVMKGYYKDPAATSKAIDTFGWFDTGDLGCINPATGDLILTGRAKDTIVLSNGENIEPVPIEDAIQGNIPLIEQIMVTTASVSGDAKSLVAIAVLNPQELYTLGYLPQENVSTGDSISGPTSVTVQQLTEAMDIVNTPQCTVDEYKHQYDSVLLPTTLLLRQNKELMRYIQTTTQEVLSSSNKFRKWEYVQNYVITLVPFAMVNGQLTQSYKVKRPAVAEQYRTELLASSTD